MARVLVADDGRSVRQTLVHILVGAGYDVLEAEDGRTALDAACRERPDVVLLDVRMPGLDGFEVLRHLRDDPATESLPVILLTGVSPAKGELSGLKLGVQHYITKPFDPDWVLLAVRVVLREAAKASEESEEDNPVKEWSASRPGRTTDQDDNPKLNSGGLMGPLERILGGGIPMSSLTLVEGDSSSGKSVLCQHFAYGSLSDRHSVAYLTSEHTVGSLSMQMASLGLDVSDQVGSEQLRVHPLPRVTPTNRESVASTLPSEVERLSTQRKLVIVDAITDFMVLLDEMAVIEFFSICRWLCNEGRTIILVSESHAFGESLLTRLHSLCDTHFHLFTERAGQKVVRTVEVLKANHMDMTQGNTISFEVFSELGIQMSPVGKVKA